MRGTDRKIDKKKRQKETERKRGAREQTGVAQERKRKKEEKNGEKGK